MEALFDRVRGSIYGLLIGDALGCPVEGCTPDEIVEQFGRITDMQTPMVQEIFIGLPNR